MITLHEGLGGASVDIQNGTQKTHLEGGNFLIRDENGINWIDLDCMMQAAEEINQQQQAGITNDHA